MLLAHTDPHNPLTICKCIFSNTKDPDTKENANVARCEEWAFKVTKRDSKRHFKEADDVLAQQETRVGQIPYGISYKKILSKHLIHKFGKKFRLLETLGKLAKYITIVFYNRHFFPYIICPNSFK